MLCSLQLGIHLLPARFIPGLHSSTTVESFLSYLFNRRCTPMDADWRSRGIPDSLQAGRLRPQTAACGPFTGGTRASGSLALARFSFGTERKRSAAAMRNEILNRERSPGSGFRGALQARKRRKATREIVLSRRSGRCRSRPWSCA